MKVVLCGCHKGKAELQYCVVELVGTGYVVFFFVLSKPLPQNCCLWRLYKEMGVWKSFGSSGNSLHGARGWGFLEFPVVVLQAKKLLHPNLTSVILMHPVWKAGSCIQAHFLSCWTSIFQSSLGFWTAEDMLEPSSLNALVCFFP